MKTHFSRSLTWTRLRYLLILLLFALPYFAANSQVKINIVNQPIRSILKAIEKQSDFTFFFNEGLPELDNVTSLRVNNVNSEAAVRQLLQGTNIAYTVEGKTIVLTAKEKLGNQSPNQNPTSTSTSRSTQRVNVSGIVKDETGDPLIGVSVVLKGTLQGVITNTDGRFTIQNVPSDGTLAFSYVGMQPTEVEVNGRNRIDVSMAVESKVIDELVVIGYGTVKKRDLTGSVASLRSDEVNTISAASIGHALKGKASGLTITQNSAQPGGGLDILIRGGSGGSQFSDNTPLYIVDGFPISTIDQPGSGNERLNAGTNGVLNFINPNDISSIEVLKDASATAIYGARAAAGVVLITTKRGLTGKPTVSYGTSYGYQKHANIFDTFKLKEWMEEKNTASWDYWMFENDVIPYGARSLEQAMAAPRNGVAYRLPYTDSQIENAGEGTDWVSLVTRPGSIVQHNVGLSGGTENTKYLVSLNYFDHKGIIKNSELRRYSARINLDQKINDIFKMGVNFTASRMDNDNTPLGGEQWEKSGLIRAAVQMGPHIKAIDENGNYPINPLLPTQPNPYSLLTVTDKGKTDRLLGNIFVIAEPVKDLVFKTTFGTDLAYQSRHTYMPRTTLFGNLSGGLATINQSVIQRYLADITATYSKLVGADHNLNFMLGASTEKEVGSSNNLGNNQFIIDGMKWYNLNSGEGTKVVGSSGGEEKWVSFFSRLNYVFKDRYLFTATFRADGASIFAKNHKWGYFPSVALGWNMAEEEFMSFAKPTLDMLKLRVSYGQTGNSKFVGGNAFAAFYASPAWNTIEKNQQTGVFLGRLENPNLKWETSAVSNIGLDAMLYNGKINFVMDLYRRVTYDLLDMKALNSYQDISFVADNVGNMETKGIEFTLNTKNFSRKDFTWATDLTFTSYRINWLERAPDWKPSVYENVRDPRDVVYAREGIGILQTGEAPPASQPDLRPGQIIIKDISGYKRDLNGDPIVENGRFVLTGKPDGIIDDADTRLYMRREPKFSMGLTNRFTYQNFDFSFELNGLFGRKMMDPTYMAYGASADGIAQYGYNGLRIVKNRWMPDKQSTTIPSSFYGWSRYGYGDWFYQNASFVRLQNITLGYTLSNISELKKIVSDCRVYFDANNLYVLTKYTGLDPETDAYAAAYPNARTYTLGLEVKF